MSKLLKYLGIAFLIFIVIGIIAVNSDDKKNPTTASNTTANAAVSSTATSGEKKFVKVTSFKGNGMKKSPTFELHGNDAKLSYKYNSGETDMGMFSVYVTPAGQDVMRDGGIPEIMSQEPKEQTESTIQKEAGKYYLHVNATGKWEIDVYEEQ